jgi:hypothetical protein
LLQLLLTKMNSSTVSVQYKIELEVGAQTFANWIASRLIYCASKMELLFKCHILRVVGCPFYWVLFPSKIQPTHT